MHVEPAQAETILFIGNSVNDVVLETQPGSGLPGTLFQALNRNVDIGITATLSRADLTYNTPSPGFDGPIEPMGVDPRALGGLESAASEPGSWGLTLAGQGVVGWLGRQQRTDAT